MTLKVNMYALETSRIARLFARISKHCIVVLSTGKELEFERGFLSNKCSYEGSMTKTEEQEYIHARKMIGI